MISFFGERVSFFFLHGGYKKKEEKFPSEDDLTGVGNKTLTIVDFYKGFMVHFQIPCNIKKAFCRKECTKCFLKQRGYYSYSRPECVMRHVNFLETIFLFHFSNIKQNICFESQDVMLREWRDMVKKINSMTPNEATEVIKKVLFLSCEGPVPP